MHYVNTTEALEKLLALQDKEGEPSWWPRRYASGCHFATPEEVREYLDLCVELGESFTDDRRMLAFWFARYPMHAALMTASLLEKAGIECSMDDDRELFAPKTYLSDLTLDVMPSAEELRNLITHSENNEGDLEQSRRKLARQYLLKHEMIAQKFENKYLRKSHMIAMGDAMIELFWKYWESMEQQERWKRQTTLLERQWRCRLGLLNYRRWRKKKKVMKQAAEVMKRYDSDTMRDLEHLNKALQNCYGGARKIFPPVVALFGDCGKHDDYTLKGSKGPMGVNLVWEATNPLLMRFGGANLLRAAELRLYVMNDIQLSTEEEIKAGRYHTIDLQGIREHYPELPSKLYPYCFYTGALEEGGNISVLMNERKKEVLSEIKESQ